MRLRSKFWGTVLLSMAVFFMICGGPAWAQSAEVNALPFAGTHQPFIIGASGDVSVNGGTVTLDGAVVTVETADLNDDGVPDIVAGGGTLFAYDVANKDYLWAIDESSLELAHEIDDIAIIADVTGDGTPDVVTIDFWDPDGSPGTGSDGLCLWDGASGARIWTQAVDSGNRTRTFHAEVLDIADLDGDGNLDIAVGGHTTSVGGTSTDEYLIAAFQASDGGLLWHFYSSGYYPLCVEIGDIDGDGRPEVTAGDQAGQVYCLNGEDGTEVFTVAVPDGGCVEDIELADFDADGDLDIVAGSDGYVTAYDENGNDPIWRFDELAEAGIWSDLELADFNQDGVMDVAAVNNNGYGWAVINGATGNSINSGGLFGMGQVLAVGDLDGDGSPELVSGDDGRATCPIDVDTGNWLWLHDHMRFGGNSGEGVFDLEIADFNGDGSSAIIGVPGTKDFIYVLGGKSPYNYSAAGGVPPGFNWPGSSTQFSDVASIDADGDGDADLVAADSGRERVFAVDGETGSMIWQYQCNFGAPAEVLAPGDYDGDGNTDIAAFGSGTIYFLSADGTAMGTPGSVGVAHDHFLVADLDGNGTDELVIGDNGGTVSAGNHEGVMWTTAYIGFNNWANPAYKESGLAFGDIDGDGTDDLLALGYYSGTETCLYEIDLSESSAGDDARVTISSGIWTSIALAELDGDSASEILLGSEGGIDKYDSNGLLPGWASVDAKHGILTADLDGDGLDEAVAGGISSLHGLDDDRSVLWSEVFTGTAENYDNDDSQGIRDMALGDLDADGDLDVAAVFRFGVNLRMLDADSGAALTAAPIVMDSYGEGEIQMATGDFSSQSGTEVAVASWLTTGVFGTVMQTSDTGGSTPLTSSSSSSSGCFISTIR